MNAFSGFNLISTFVDDPTFYYNVCEAITFTNRISFLHSIPKILEPCFPGSRTHLCDEDAESLHRSQCELQRALVMPGASGGFQLERTRNELAIRIRRKFAKITTRYNPTNNAISPENDSRQCMHAIEIVLHPKTST
ncbi:hypothetical protein GX48_04619 [Paracoccidioides brasiliensis]|nr:hypothetical protein GX48_04619 [Paracoccidioides brasiliensis]